MSRDVLVVAERLRDSIAEVTFELLGQGKALATATGGSCNCALIGGSDAMVEQLGAADRIIRVDGDAVREFNPESHAAALRAIVEAAPARVVLLAYTSMGMDLATTLAVETGMPQAASCLAVEAGDTIRTTSQLYGGKMNVTQDLGRGPCVVTMLAGAGPAEAGKKRGAPKTETVPAPPTQGRVRFKKLIEPEAGDVDITAAEVLVAIGRGVGNKSDVKVAEDLAHALGAAVAASRPLIDAGWLPKTRQVGKSGLKVSPKVYLALGISGAPEHLEGMKSASTIIAVNTDKNAPIFGVAHYGLVADLFEVAEELTRAVESRKG